jgi:starch synthase (maltosyl-transferring)
LSRAYELARLELSDTGPLAHAVDPGARVKIRAITPAVDAGAFPVKRSAGDSLIIEADIVADGHGKLAAAAIVGRKRSKSAGHRVPMINLGNDRWRSEAVSLREGVYAFFVEAWLDVYGGYARDLEKKLLAGQDVALDIEEGRALIQQARQRSRKHVQEALDAILDGLKSLTPRDQARLLLAGETVATMASADNKPFLARSYVQDVEAERKRAGFASWYEMFPRSQTNDPARHGTLRDVIARLPDLAAMGFDVLYFPPIHPIGTTNRKGRNNSLVALPTDPGSPYAIGSAEGGHDALHPELGTFDDFHALSEAARSHGIEIALDFAIQCSPDHPWLREHPGWFDWRSDGSLRYAENPPKKYEDIVNVDFYAPDAVPGLWVALRDVIEFWVGKDVKIFRVDNPHTKPMPFWQWLIADVRQRHPEVIFLCEAFTRPKIMYELARVGFNESYTYFTWRNTKSELTDYMTELTTSPVCDFFRPHFFTSTPDINPVYLQSGERSAFLIRAALAATLSGLWGMYSGFELCEHEPIPGREEYQDSEKYEIKVRDWKRPGNIISEISALNALRKHEPALQSHLNIKFYNAFNDQIIYYAKTAPGRLDRVLVMVNLDPFHVQACNFEIPLWEWNLPDEGSLSVEDLLYGYRFTWAGKIQSIALDPSAPYRIWRVRPEQNA